MSALVAQDAAARLEANARVFEALVDGVSEEQASWRPEPDKWSILEVVNHIADEELADFRQRFEMTLHDPTAAWPPIDPQRWAVERRYNERDLVESLGRFLAERDRSVVWLRGLSAPLLDRQHEHPQGALRAGDLLASWLDHDLIHIRQITRLHHQWLVRTAEPYRTEYAGGF